MAYLFKNHKGVKYRIKWHKMSAKYYGLCDDPKSDKPQIQIEDDLNRRMTINLIIHEVLHAFFWNVPEKKVNKFANVASRLIEQRIKEKFNK